jgi:hypothetical protein
VHNRGCRVAAMGPRP